MYLCFQARDPRVKVSIGKVTFTDVKEKYGGIFSIAYRDETPLDVITLKVLRKNITLCCILKASIRGNVYWLCAAFLYTMS